MYKTRRRSIITILCALCMTLVLATVLVACNGDDKPTQKATSFVTIDVNPSVELVLDQNNQVMSVAAANSDAEVMLWNEDGIVGVNVNVAAERIGELAVELGYVTEENNSVSISIAASGSVNVGELYNTIKAEFSTAVEAANDAIKVSVEQAVDLVLEKELEEIKSANAGKDGYGDELTLPRYRLIKRAMIYDRSLKLDAAVKMTNEELSEKVRSVQANVSTKLGKTYQLAAREAQFVYDTARQTATDSLYSVYFIDKIVNEPLKFMDYGKRAVAAAAYTANRAAYVTLEHYYYALRDYLDDPIYTEDDAQAVFNAIATVAGGIEWQDFKAEITDENGNVTKEKISAYINKLYRNVDAEKREELETVYASIKQSVLDAYEFIGDIANADVEATITATVDGQQAQITASFTSLSSVIDSIASFISNTVNSVFGSIKDITIDDVKNALSVENALAKYNQNIQKAYEDMNLTQEDLTAIKEMETSLNDTLSQATVSFNNAVTAAKNAAEAFLKEQKQFRIEANIQIKR